MGTELYFREREDSHLYDVGLPKRYLSSDGRCAVEPILKPPARLPARASPKQAAAAALSVIRKCVNGRPSLGGAAINFGGDNNLAVTVTAFHPSVTCEGRVGGPGILRSCEGIIDRMNASRARTLFGPRARSDAEVRLPYIDRADEKCVMTITSRYDQVDRSSWYRLWEAATAINAMCVRHGRAGSWKHVGAISDLGHLSISLGDESMAEGVGSLTAIE